MDPVSIGILGLQGISAVSGLLGAARARRRAREARAKALSSYMASLDAEVNGMYGSGRRSMYEATGLLGDKLNSTGANLGSAMARAGVYNSSATAGALAEMGASGNASIAKMASEIDAAAKQRRNQGLQWIAGQEIGAADADMANANASTGGLLETIAGLAQAYQSAQGGGKKPEQANTGNPVNSGVVFGPVGGPNPAFDGSGLTNGFGLDPLMNMMRSMKQNSASLSPTTTYAQYAVPTNGATYGNIDPYGPVVARRGRRADARLT